MEKGNINNIAAISDGKEQITVIKNYSAEELDALNNEYVKDSLKISDYDADISELNTAKKVVKKKAATTLAQIKKGFVEQRYDAYYIDDYDEGVRQYYDEHGTMVNERKLKNSERINQRIIFN